MSNNTLNALSTSTVKASLILKHGNSAEWTAVDPVLLKGELGVEINTGLMKVGDGVKSWNNLTYINSSTESVNALSNKVEGILNSCIQKPETAVNGNLPIFDENRNLIDSGVSIRQYTEGFVASEGQPGMVISSSDDNSISVDKNGKMSINRISASSLFIPEGEELTLFAGNSTN